MPEGKLGCSYEKYPTHPSDPTIHDSIFHPLSSLKIPECRSMHEGWKVSRDKVWFRLIRTELPSLIKFSRHLSFIFNLLVEVFKGITSSRSISLRISTDKKVRWLMFLDRNMWSEDEWNNCLGYSLNLYYST